MTGGHDCVLDLVISIVNDNNREGVRGCLHSIPGAARRIGYVVNLVDNVSTDGSVTMLANEFPGVVVRVNAQRQGFAVNHNQVLGRVVAARTARYVLVLNDDTELHEGALDALVDAMDRVPSVGAMVPVTFDRDGREAAMRLEQPSAVSSWRYDWRGIGELPDPEGGWLQGCCLLLRTEAIAEVGFFDEQFFLFYEDGDLSRRLADAKWGLELCREAKLTHIGHQTVLRSELAIFTPMQGLRSRYLYFAKYEGRSRSLLIAWVGRGLMGARGVRLILSGVRHRHLGRLRQGWVFLILAAYDPRRAVSLPPRPVGVEVAPPDAQAARGPVGVKCCRSDESVRRAGGSRTHPDWWPR